MIGAENHDLDRNVITTFFSRNENDTMDLGAALAAHLRQTDILALEGTLGMGKTALARGLIRRLCGNETVVASPTFTLIQVYDRPDFPIWHCDLYRVETVADAFEIGLDEAFANAVTLIEWPERLGSRLPGRCLHIRFLSEAADGSRKVALEGDVDWRRRIEGLSIHGRP